VLVLKRVGLEPRPHIRPPGARHDIGSSAQKVAEALSALGGLGRNGTLVIVGVSSDAVEVPTAQAIMGRYTAQGWPSGTAADS